MAFNTDLDAECAVDGSRCVILVTVKNSVAICIGIVGVCSEVQFTCIIEMVVVGIHEERVGSAGDLGTVGERIPVRVYCQRIGVVLVKLCLIQFCTCCSCRNRKDRILILLKENRMMFPISRDKQRPDLSDIHQFLQNLQFQFL